MRNWPHVPWNQIASLLNLCSTTEPRVHHSLCCQSIRTTQMHTLRRTLTHSHTRARGGEPDACRSVDSRLQRRSCSLSAPAGLLALRPVTDKRKSFKHLFHFALDCTVSAAALRQGKLKLALHEKKKKKNQKRSRSPSTFLAESLMESFENTALPCKLCWNGFALCNLLSTSWCYNPAWLCSRERSRTRHSGFFSAIHQDV